MSIIVNAGLVETEALSARVHSNCTIENTEHIGNLLLSACLHCRVCDRAINICAALALQACRHARATCHGTLRQQRLHQPLLPTLDVLGDTLQVAVSYGRPVTLTTCRRRNFADVAGAAGVLGPDTSPPFAAWSGAWRSCSSLRPQCRGSRPPRQCLPSSTHTQMRSAGSRRLQQQPLSFRLANFRECCVVRCADAASAASIQMQVNSHAQEMGRTTHSSPCW